MSISQYPLLEQQARQLRRAELSHLAAGLISSISEALRSEHEQLLRRRQSLELLRGAPLRSTIGTPA